MAKCKETIYLNAEYKVISKSPMIQKKYGNNPKFLLEDTADVVLGKKWLGTYPKAWDFDRRPIVVTFLARMSAQGIEDFKNETILYGKLYDTISPFGISELFLLKELQLEHSVVEFDNLLTKDKIKIKEL